MNYMCEVATILGLEFWEFFELEGADKKYSYCLMESGLWEDSQSGSGGYAEAGLLERILKGDLEIKRIGMD